MKNLQMAIGKTFEGFVVTRINEGYEGSYLFMIELQEINTNRKYTVCVNDSDSADKYYHCEIFRGGEFKLLKESASLYRLALNLKVQLI